MKEMLFRNILPIMLIFYVQLPSALAIDVARQERQSQQFYRAVRKAQSLCGIPSKSYMKAGERSIERFKAYSKLRTADKNISEERISCLAEKICSDKIIGVTVEQALYTYRDAEEACRVHKMQSMRCARCRDKGASRHDMNFITPTDIII